MELELTHGQAQELAMLLSTALDSKSVAGEIKYSSSSIVKWDRTEIMKAREKDGLGGWKEQAASRNARTITVSFDDITVKG